MGTPASGVLVRAKLRVSSVQDYGTQETLNFTAVCEMPFDPEGYSDDNTYARYTPMATLVMSVNNPALLGKIKAGQRFYVDFTPAE